MGELVWYLKSILVPQTTNFFPTLFVASFSHWGAHVRRVAESQTFDCEKKLAGKEQTRAMKYLWNTKKRL